MNDITYDVAIVGAGPAGSTAAKFLSEKGLKVILIEKHKFPRDKSCGGGLSNRVLVEFDYINNERFIESYSYCGIAHSPTLKNKIEVHEKNPIIASVLREKFDYELVKLAKENGTYLLEGKSVRDFEILKDEVKIILDNKAIINSKVLIGADGVWSLIAKKTGLRPSQIDYGVCTQKEFEVD